MATDTLPDQIIEEPRGDEIPWDMSKAAIYRALYEAKKAFPVIPKSASGLHSKYAKLEHIEQIIQPILYRHGLTYIQPAYTGPDKITRIKTVLIHESGQTLTLGEIGFVPEDARFHSQASGMAYAKRYGVCSALTITCEDEDDDGNGGRGNGKKGMEAYHKENGGPRASVDPMGNEEGGDPFWDATGPYPELMAQISRTKTLEDLSDAKKNANASAALLTPEDTERLQRAFKEREAVLNG